MAQREICGSAGKDVHVLLHATLEDLVGTPTWPQIEKLRHSDWSDFAIIYKDARRRQGYLAWVAYAAHATPVGIALCEKERGLFSEFDTEDTRRHFGVFVAPTHRRTGVGTTLVRATHEAFPDIEFCRWTLEAHRFFDAVETRYPTMSIKRLAQLVANKPLSATAK